MIIQNICLKEHRCRACADDKIPISFNFSSFSFLSISFSPISFLLFSFSSFSFPSFSLWNLFNFPQVDVRILRAPLLHRFQFAPLAPFSVLFSFSFSQNQDRMQLWFYGDIVIVIWWLHNMMLWCHCQFVTQSILWYFPTQLKTTNLEKSKNISRCEVLTSWYQLLKFHRMHNSA